MRHHFRRMSRNSFGPAGNLRFRLARSSPVEGCSVFDQRTWYIAHSKPRPGKGFAAEVRHLPRLAEEIAKAEAKVRELGLLTADETGPDR